MWNDVSQPWQKAFELAWISYQRNTIPIGCVIVDEDGKVVSEGRNRIYDELSSHPLAQSIMGHGEMSALFHLKVHHHPRIKNYTLYSTMEPCPMCFGTCVMMNIRRIVYAAQDHFAGATSLHDKLEYIHNKQIKLQHVGHDLEVFQLVMQTAFEMTRDHPRRVDILNAWSQTNKIAVTLGQELSQHGVFNTNRDISDVYNEVLYRYHAVTERRCYESRQT